MNVVLSFSLSKFITSGGLDTSDPINESSLLLRRAGHTRYNVQWLNEDRQDKVGIEVSALRTYQEMSSLPPGVDLVPYKTFSYRSEYVLFSDQDSNPNISKRTLNPEATASFLLSKRRSGEAYTEADRAAKKVTERMLANKVLNIGYVSKED